MTTYEKPLEADDQFIGCGTCGPKPQILPADHPLAVGFGEVIITLDGEILWAGDDPDETIGDVWTEAFPDADWRVQFMGPLSDATYQWQPELGWVLIGTGRGFITD